MTARTRTASRPGHRVRTLFLGALATGLGFGTAAAAPAGPLGLWQADDGRGVIDIYPCGATICGRVARVDVAGAPPDDIRNPDPAKRGRALCGLQIIGGLVNDGDTWTEGWIYDPERGSGFSVEVEAIGGDRLRVRGWLGLRMLGETHVWHRAAAGTVPCFGTPEATAAATPAPVR